MVVRKERTRRFVGRPRLTVARVSRRRKCTGIPIQVARYGLSVAVESFATSPAYASEAFSIQVRYVHSVARSCSAYDQKHDSVGHASREIGVCQYQLKQTREFTVSVCGWENAWAVHDSTKSCMADV